jgi:hypothetical protein
LRTISPGFFLGRAREFEATYNWRLDFWILRTKLDENTEVASVGEDTVDLLCKDVFNAVD